MKTLHTLSLVALAWLGLAGCYGSAEEGTGGATLGLVEEAPLPLVARSSWLHAPAGCEDRLGDVGSFGVAEGEPALVVALSANGESICVDALEAVDWELRDEGDDPAADDLCRRYLMVIEDSTGTRRETSSTYVRGGPREGDPSPQPNLGAGLTLDKGDPSPQPNLEVTSSDEGKTGTNSADPGSSSGSATTSTTTTTTPREGDPSPQPNSQAMQTPGTAPAPAASSE